MNSCGCFESTLHYATPAHGGWGVVRIGMLAPESYQLFISPFACGRHGALGILKQGLKDRISYYYIDQSDIINGYDNLILEAADELLNVLKKRPRAIFVFVSCLDDLIGTDCDAVEAELELRYPDIQFRIAHMNPITLGSDEPPPVGIQKRVYSLLAKQPEHDGGINSVGNLVALDPECELHRLLEKNGFPALRHVSQYECFDQWQEMAKSSFNLVLMPPGVKAAKEMEKRCNIPYRFFPVSYDMDDVAEQYQQIQDFLKPKQAQYFDFTEDRQAAQAAIERAVKKLGKLPIILDSSAVVRPFSLAKALSGYGFAVHTIVAQEVIPSDKAAYNWVLQNLPTVEIIQPQHNDIVKFDKRFPKSLSIGVNAAYICGSEHVVDLFADEGLFGYYGIRRFMELLEEATDTVIDLRALIEDYGLVV
ncbi:nitrogenase component 1 [Clostridium merdae]|uniref:nitrogenase component 1 n=1 Tax=Clostridium merdae TaxID=1958780 RepID=UPI000A271214|nr:nitrogenase component 1 [Clostridium merdae]